MRILITNDDGIHAHGLAVLQRIARALSDDVTIVAPANDQSGVSHSLSLSDPLRLRTISPKHHALKGTPTDCVIMAIRHLMKDAPPDLVLSGVNSGQNAAEDVIYSGTIAGAMEGALLGVPSIALSQAYGPAGRDAMHWDCAEVHAPDIIRKVLAAGIARDTLVNLNFPNCAPQDVAGVAVTRQGRRDAQFIEVDARLDGRGLPYYWLAFTRAKQTPDAQSDLAALAQRKVSLTSLRVDLTDAIGYDRFLGAFG